MICRIKRQMDYSSYAREGNFIPSAWRGFLRGGGVLEAVDGFYEEVAESSGRNGVDVKGPVALKKKLEELNALRERWKSPYSDSELMDEIRVAWRGREGAAVQDSAEVGMDEQSVLFFEEEVYHKADDRKAAWHFFEPVTVELNGRDEAFLTNISVIDFTRGGERLFSLELTIENPISNAEGMAAPASGRQAQHPNGVSDVRVAAFESFVKKEKNQIERKAGWPVLYLLKTRMFCMMAWLILEKGENIW